MRRPYRLAKAAIDSGLATQPKLEADILSAPVVGDACVSSAVVAAGRSSDFGLPTKRRFPFFSRTVRDQRSCVVRSHHRCESVPESHRLPV